MMKPQRSQSRDAHAFTKKGENFTQTLSARKLINGNCFLKQEMSADGGIHATRDHSVTSVL
jgi:hypothetical protein